MTSRMRRAAALAAGLAAALPAEAGRDNVKFPWDYLRGTLYATVDRADIKQYRELYASPGVLEAVRAGKPIPAGAVLTLVQWSVQQDAQGNPVKDKDGRFVKKDIVGHTVMEKRSGWGAEYPESLRNGEWEYNAFDRFGRENPKANIRACFECHKPHEKNDFVISLAKLAGTFPPPVAAAKAPKGDVAIVGFTFAPAKASASAGRPLTFVNRDDSPHWIAVQGGPQKTPVLLRGQSGSITFDKPGTYQYICGLHPTMKGVIEVK